MDSTNFFGEDFVIPKSQPNQLNGPAIVVRYTLNKKLNAFGESEQFTNFLNNVNLTAEKSENFLFMFNCSTHQPIRRP